MADTRPPQVDQFERTPSRRRRRSIVLAALVLVSLLFAYVGADRETTTVENARTARASGPNDGFVPLSAGITHYRFDGPAGGSVVLLVHGYMDTMADWDAVVPGLAAAGWRVLRFDSYGTGLSARPPVPYTRAVLRRQILDLLDRLCVRRPDIAGHSLGGAVSVDFAANHPNRVGRLALLAPAVHVDLPQLTFVRLPVVGAYAARTYLMPGVARRLGVRAREGQAWAGAAVEHLRYKGTEAGFLSIIQGDGFSDYIPACRRVGSSGLQVLLAWGSEDRLVGRPAMEEARAAMPGAEWHELAGAAHELPMDSADRVTPLLVGFLGGGVRR